MKFYGKEEFDYTVTKKFGIFFHTSVLPCIQTDESENFSISPQIVVYGQRRLKKKFINDRSKCLSVDKGRTESHGENNLQTNTKFNHFVAKALRNMPYIDSSSRSNIEATRRESHILSIPIN